MFSSISVLPLCSHHILFSNASFKFLLFHFITFYYYHSNYIILNISGWKGWECSMRYSNTESHLYSYEAQGLRSSQLGSKQVLFPYPWEIELKLKLELFFCFLVFFFGAFLEVFLGVSVEVLWSFFCLGVLLILVWTKLLSLFIDLCVHSTFKLLLTLPFHFLSPSFSIFLPLSFTYSLRTAQDVFPLSSTGVP